MIWVFVCFIFCTSGFGLASCMQHYKENLLKGLHLQILYIVILYWIIFVNLLLLTLISKTLCSRYSNTVKASTECNWLIEVTVHNILSKVSCLWRYLMVAIYLNVSEHFILLKMPQMIICYVVSAIPRTSLMKICSNKAKRKKRKKKDSKWRTIYNFLLSVRLSFLF